MEGFWLTIIIFLLIVIAALDFWVIVVKKETSLSQQIYYWTIKYPLLPFFVGLCVGTLIGHFWPMF